MGFYNNLFVSAYRFYNRFYEANRSRFRTVMIMGLHVIGWFFITIAAIIKIFVVDLTRFHHITFYILVLTVFFLVCSFLLKYYSEYKIEQIILKFEEKGHFERKLWGYITTVSLVLEYVIIALLLSR